MYKSFLKKSKTELVRIILLLFALVLALGLLSATKLVVIEKDVTEISGYMVPRETDPYQVEPGTAVTPRDEVTPTPTPRRPRCIRFRSYRICGPRM